MTDLLKKLVGGALDMIPGGSIVKSLADGAASLLIRKAAGKVGISDEKVDELLDAGSAVAARDPEVQAQLAAEEQQRREFELDFYGRAADLSPKAQFWRAATRPIITFSLIGLFVIGTLTGYVQQVLETAPLEIPPSVVELTKWVVAFWFSGRSAEKIIGMFNGKK